jgi:hypothetical protein
MQPKVSGRPDPSRQIRRMRVAGQSHAMAAQPNAKDTASVPQACTGEEIQMPSQNGNGDRGGPWGTAAKADSDSKDLVRQGQDRFKQIMPSGGPRGAIVVAVLALVGLWHSDKPPAVHRVLHFLGVIGCNRGLSNRDPIAANHRC